MAPFSAITPEIVMHSFSADLASLRRGIRELGKDLARVCRRQDAEDVAERLQAQPAVAFAVKVRCVRYER